VKKIVTGRLVGLGVPALVMCATLLALMAVPAFAAQDELTTVIDNLRTWAMGILVAVATLFLTLGGIRYLLAGGNPRAVEEAKGAIKNAVIGYVLAALAPAILGVVRQIVGH
jgi:Type IV secretion system pilin